MRPAEWDTNPSWLPRPVRRKEVDLRIVPLGFLALILVGTVLLLLPWTRHPGHPISLLDAFFLSASATCLTGLTPVDISQTLNGFGQAVLLCLIQCGGLGIFTASISLALLSGSRLSLADEQTIHAVWGRLRDARPLDVFIYACLFVLLFELGGTVALFLLLSENLPQPSPWHGLWESLFHSVSAFCNAGISLHPEGAARWRPFPGILAVLDILVIAGGLGLMTLINLRFIRFWRRDPRRRGYLTLQTRLTIITTAFLLVGGALVTLAFEGDHTLKDARGWEHVTWPLFHSVMCRSAGFNLVDVNQMNPPTLLATLPLMLIGGAPGSMAGGIKVVTFALLLLTAWSALRRTEQIQVFGRRIPRHLLGVATMLALLAGAVLLGGVGLLMITELGHPAAQTPYHWFGLVFEAFSAFGTVGFSTGVTPLLTPLGKLVIIALLFTGRVGPLVLAVYLARPKNPLHVRYPAEELALG